MESCVCLSLSVCGVSVCVFMSGAAECVGEMEHDLPSAPLE